MSPTLCPTCGRRPSERSGLQRGWVKTSGSTNDQPTDYWADCPDPIHDRADACEEMAAACKSAARALDLRRQLEARTYGSQVHATLDPMTVVRAENDARALLARLEGGE